MNMFNQIVVEGRLTDDPVLRTTSKGAHVVSFNLANNYDDANNGVLYFSVQAWSKLADIVKEQYKKGSWVVVIGKMINNSYTAKDGKQVARTIVRAQEIRGIGFANAGKGKVSKEPVLEKEPNSIPETTGGYSQEEPVMEPLHFETPF